MAKNRSSSRHGESTQLPPNKKTSSSGVESALGPRGPSVGRTSDSLEERTPEQLSSSTLSAPKSPYISTTEEEETMSLHHPSSARIGSYAARSQSSTTSLRRRSHRSASRAFSHDSPGPEDSDAEDDWDYSETEWWGWIILIVTWIVFVVVMGSCFGVWSWAWDVGETPYAPPDLEDDDTLPITGYYPALMVCTAVMSWVWVVVAWVGMKYFRHAKVVADDG